MDFQFNHAYVLEYFRGFVSSKFPGISVDFNCYEVAHDFSTPDYKWKFYYKIGDFEYRAALIISYMDLMQYNNSSIALIEELKAAVESHVNDIIKSAFKKPTDEVKIEESVVTPGRRKVVF